MFIPASINWLTTNIEDNVVPTSFIVSSCTQAGRHKINYRINYSVVSFTFRNSSTTALCHNIS